ncbi:hypothetical protein GCM10008111_31790 [Alishewanella tabrizica]|uniref:Uncharacterized protein n=1 Tax=Alishewanella tabrizica TaxID=671278 RepID=A0ABQ2WWZ2_9ALTE|nr:hypothetical protein GCM10008111_31790 [Alishewanella tabrizica]
MWGELWQGWASAFPQDKSVLIEKSGHITGANLKETIEVWMYCLKKHNKTHHSRQLFADMPTRSAVGHPFCFVVGFL